MVIPLANSDRKTNFEEYEKMENKKPRVKLVGENGNVFNLTGICSKALKEVGMKDESKEMCSRIFKCGFYHEALAIMMEYCDVK
jgi:hypothetical protein